MSQAPTNKKNNLLIVILVGLGLILLICGGFMLFKGRKPNEETGDLGTDEFVTLRENVIKEIGVKELSGEASNTEVEKYFEELGYNEKDDTPWCAAFVNYQLKKAGYEYADKTKKLSSLRARDLEKIAGKDIELTDALPYSTVVVAWRENENTGLGHVGFFVRDDGDNVILCGGNQSDEVNDTYKLAKNRITRVFNPKQKA